MREHTRAMKSRFGANGDPITKLQEKRKMLKHTRAAKTHFGVKEQTMTLRRCEKCESTLER